MKLARNIVIILLLSCVFSTQSASAETVRQPVEPSPYIPTKLRFSLSYLGPVRNCKEDNALIHQIDIDHKFVIKSKASFEPDHLRIWSNDSATQHALKKTIESSGTEGFGVPMGVDFNSTEPALCIGLTEFALYGGSALENKLFVWLDSPIPPQRPISPDEAKIVSGPTLTPDRIAIPGQSLKAILELRNTSDVTWGPGYELVFISGDQMGAQPDVKVPVTPHDKTAKLSVDVIAPVEAGIHQGYWRLSNPQGTFFGDDVWIQVEVSRIEGESPPTPNGGPSIILECLDCPATVAPGQKFRPTIHANVNSGDLQGKTLRGDMLRHKSGDLFGAWPHVAVPGDTVIHTNDEYDFTFYEDNPITAPTTPGKYSSVWQVWRNGGWDGEEITIEFEVKEGSSGSNHAPNAPSATHPSDWVVYVGNETITLNAKRNGDPDGDDITHYYFEIYDSAENPNSGWITSASWSPPTLGYNLYQWRVKVKDARGAESPWSEKERRFTVQTNEPQIYNFSYDYCDKWGGNPERICFCVDTNAETVKLQVNSATDGSDSGDWYTFYELGTSDLSCEQRQAQWGQLSYEAGGHLVRLYARIGSGWVNAAYADRVINLPAERRPSGVHEIYPLNNSYLNTRQVLFDWDPSLRTTEYRLEIALNSDGSGQLVNTVLPASTTEYAHTFGEAYPNLYWRIKAIGPYGESDNGWQLFHIDQTPPSTSMTSLPTAIVETKFTVQWSGTDSQSGLNWYHVQVRDGNRSGSEWQDWLVNTTKQAEIFDGLAGHTYYFRVRAMDTIGNWEGWPSGDGDTQTRIDPLVALDIPWWNTGYAHRRNLTILNNDNQTMPDHFPVALRFDTTTTPTAAEIYNASLSPTKGDDVRVILNNQTQLDRVVYTFTPDLIELWFSVQTPISGAQADSTSYQLYYGNTSAGSPPTTTTNIFAPTPDGNTVLLTNFQEGQGTTINDASGLGHNGNFINGGWVDGYLGHAGYFNGVNTQVDFGNHSDFDLLGPFTIETWIYLVPYEGSSNYRRVRVVDKNRYALRVESDRKPYFAAHDVIVAGGGCASLELNRWYHFAGTFDGVNRARIYINGALCHEWTSNDARIRNSSFALKFGIESSAPDTDKFSGYLQHVRISNVERTIFPYAWIDVPPSVVAGAAAMQPGSGQADLAILDMQAYPDESGDVVVAAIVQNQGDANTQNGFYTDLYVDHLPTGSGDYTGSLQFWVNSPIEPGAVVTLTTKVTNLAATIASEAEEDSDTAISDEVSSTAATATVSEQTAILYAQVDSAGLVREQDKSNNIYGTGLEVCTASKDALEPDNTVAQAKQLKVGQGYNHNQHVAGDSDWGKLSATGGVTYVIRTDTLGPTADTYLYLYDTNGTTLLASNDDTAVSLASEIIWKAPENDIYYVVVKHWNAQAGGCGATYKLTISEEISPDPEPNPTPKPSPEPSPEPSPGQNPDQGNAVFLHIITHQE